MFAASVETPAVRLPSRAAAEAYVASVCFKHGPPRRLGVELEWIVLHAGDPRRSLDAEHLADALGVHAPPTIRPDSPNALLPAGSRLTVEPGGQVEISTPPCDSLSELLATATRDADTVSDLITAAGLRLAHTGVDPYRPPTRLVHTPRYDAMYQSYRRDGPSGALMMCSTAAVQPCLDAGNAGHAGDSTVLRWRALYALGPVLVAAFANSPVLGGTVTGWASTRMALWADINHGACPPGLGGLDPASSYARHVMEVPLRCVRRPGGDWLAPHGVTFADWLDGALPGRPTIDDLDYHLSTVFPPVRPRGHLEVRYLDAQPRGCWPLPVAVLAALLADDAGAEAAIRLAAPTADRWLDAARRGLADPELRAAATAVFELACRRLPQLRPPAWLQRELEQFTEEVGRP